MAAQPGTRVINATTRIGTDKRVDISSPPLHRRTWTTLPDNLGKVWPTGGYGYRRKGKNPQLPPAEKRGQGGARAFITPRRVECQSEKRTSKGARIQRT